MDIEQQILEFLPQQIPFRFVDEITKVNEETIEGTYRFRDDEFFYSGHFPELPITPGVILTECMAQISLVCHGIYFLIKQQVENPEAYQQFFTSNEIQFLKPVYPGDKVSVSARKEYFRHGKFKSTAVMKNLDGEVVCKGTLSGMVFKNK